ncbi:MAG TPA: 30S ribosomal protein S8 [Patescibacteria group bacterium]|nr:30S ribosomal protein S8 [Patescibacteria group bacterium]
MITDPISDMLTRIRNASMVKKAEVRIPYSNLKYAVAKILAEEGYVGSVEKVATGHGEIRLTLKYAGGEAAIRNITRVSKPGHRAYAGYADLPRVLSDHGIAIVSTSQGVMTNKEARKRKLGGEVLCEVF